ncbi:MAG: succinate dehydrogenase cytochrome b subunit [Muribaculaceae bacterium]|nr:succinate dehydrogenase cytochrome b subunit [Muribaculaceae bacterium]
MWLTSSSIGRKFIMALTGCALVLFVTFHVLMNAVALIWPTAYNQVCEFLGANWYALVASAGLGLLLIIHIIYALWLTVQNRAARGNDRYAVTSRPPQVEWSSKNMLVLGIVVLAFLVVHLIQFWAKMQWQELRHADLEVLPQLEGVPAAPALGTLFIQMAFSQVWTPIVYIIGFVALWFHMNHGFWSMFHTVGWDNQVWISRLKKIACVWTSVVVALFIAQAIVFTVKAHDNFYLTDKGLQEQYSEFWNSQAEDVFEDFQVNMFAALNPHQGNMLESHKAQQDFVNSYGPGFIARTELIAQSFEKQCPDCLPGDALRQIQQIASQLQMMMQPMAGGATPRVSAANPAGDGAAEQAEEDNVQ